MIKVVIAGAAGRMGCRLVSLVRDSTAFTLGGALEGKSHHALGDDAGETAGSGRAGVPITDNLSALMERGEVVIDFSSSRAGRAFSSGTPSCATRSADRRAQLVRR